MKRRAYGLVVVAAGTLMFASPAWGETVVGIVSDGSGHYPDEILEVRGGSERNVITVSGTRVHDESALVTASDEGGCVAEGPHTAHCPDYDDGILLELDAGGGDDEVSVQDTQRWSLLSGGAGDDVMSASAGRNWFHVDAGADRLEGGAGLDVADYSWFSDGAPIVGVNVSLNGRADDGRPGEGDDVGREFDAVLGNEGGDVLDLAGAPDAVAHGGAGGDWLIGGPGRQTLVGEGDVDVLVGGAGDDLLADRDHESCPAHPIWLVCATHYGGSATAPNVLDGGDGADDLRGYEGDDMLDGGAGDDLLAGGQGADDVRGGDGADTAPTDIQRTGFPLPPDLPVAVSLDDVADDGADTDRHLDNLHGDIEEILGTDAADTLIGDSGDETLRGGAGNDVIEGLAGRDSLYGEDGDDELRARDGEADLVDCGNAFDLAVADLADVVTPTCERRDMPPAPGPPPGPAPPVVTAPVTSVPGPSVAVPDRLRPSVKLSGVTRRVGRERLLRRGLRLFLAPGEPVSIEVALRLPGGRRLAARRVTVTDGSRRLRLRIPSAQRRHVPRRGRRLRLLVRAVDRAGNVTVLRRTLRLR